MWGSRFGGEARQGAIHTRDVDASPGGLGFEGSGLGYRVWGLRSEV